MSGNGEQPGRTDTNTAQNLQRIAQALDEVLNPLRDAGQASTGFALLVFGFDLPGIANYVSNANRADMITAFKETVKRLEGGEDNVRHGDEVVIDYFFEAFRAGANAGQDWEKLGPMGETHLKHAYDKWRNLE